MSKLTRKVALATGGSRGIGAAIAKRLAADGASVAIRYSKGADAAASVVNAIEGAGGEAIATQADAADADAVKSAVEKAVAKFGRLDVLVNNAGTAIPKPFAIVLEAFDTLFNKRDYAAAERFWSPKYIQHSAHIAPGREGLFALIRSAPDTLRYENQLIVAEGDYVIAHGRFSGNGRPAAWIAADIVRFEEGLLAEHWDVLQEEATQEESVSGLPMFGDRFPS
jgi:predicted SnoaL-like aldol condensation-catalyzing enzyme